MDLRKKYDNTGKRKNTLPSLARDIASDWGSGSYNIGNINGVRSTPKTTPGISGVSQPVGAGDISAAVSGVLGNQNYSDWLNKTKAGQIISNPADSIPKTSYTGGNTVQQEQITIPTSVGELPTYNSEYMDKLNELARQLTSMNYDDWTKGSQYQALAGRYGNNGRMSMQDVLGQIASRTGGLASSYATTAAQQQYNQYMAQLEEVARQMYSQDRSDLMDNANLYRNLANDEYDRYRDSVADYNERLAAAQAAARAAYKSTSKNVENTVEDNTTNIVNGAADRVKSIANTILGSIYGGSKKNTGSSASTNYKDTTAYDRAVSYAKEGAQSRRTANLLQGYVDKGEITADQARKIMDELY